MSLIQIIIDFLRKLLGKTKKQSINQAPGARKPSFENPTIQSLSTNAHILKERLLREIDVRLQSRDRTLSYEPADSVIFQPLVDVSVINFHGVAFYSFVFQAALEVKEMIENYEDRHGIKVNKADLYFTLAMNSILNNSTINATIFWELSQLEESLTNGVSFNPVASLHATISRFTTVISAVESGLDNNEYYRNLKNAYPWLSDFKGNFLQMGIPNAFSYFACGVRNRAGTDWLENTAIEMPKMYSQELLNSLCILAESLLKTKPALAPFVEYPLGNVLKSLDLHNPAVAGILGKPKNPKTLLFVTYPSGSKVEFDTNFPTVLNLIKTGTLSNNELKAYLIYGIYMIRNKALHNYDPTLVYYNNPVLFKETIGLIFAGIAAILNT